MMIEPSEIMLNSCLSEVKKIYTTEVGSSDAMIALTEACIATRTTMDKVYVLLVWMLIAEPVRRFFSKDENPQRFQLFMSVLHIGFDFFLTGRMPDGCMFGDTDDLAKGAPAVFVHRIIQFYANES